VVKNEGDITVWLPGGGKSTFVKGVVKTKIRLFFQVVLYVKSYLVTL